MFTGAHKMQRMVSVFADIYLELYDKDGDAFLNHIVRVTAGEAWVSFVIAQTKEQ
jgi:hypothetical protein